MMIVGIDPDTQAHGVAIFQNGELTRLEQWPLMELMAWVQSVQSIKYADGLIFSIENVLANGFVYARNVQSSGAANAKVAKNIGQCQQSQTELMRMLDYLGVPYVLHNPAKSNWAKNRAMFEKVTGWNIQSNEDKRSAAYFGWLEAKR